MGNGNQVEERVVVFTEDERIEGTIFRMPSIRVSDAFNAESNHNQPFLKVKSPIISCRRTGETIASPGFVLVGRSRIVMVMTDLQAQAIAPRAVAF